MAQGSSLPPLKTSRGKYWFVLLPLLMVGIGAWLYWSGGEEQAATEVVPPPEPEPIAREQFQTEIEIPEEEEEEEVGTHIEEAPKEVKRRRPRETFDCRGSLEPQQIRSVINGAPRKQVQTCYEQRLKDNNLLQGQMTVLLTIGPSGAVRNVSVSGSLRDPQVVSCVKRVARTWRFPRPEGGCVMTSVPFTMTPKL